MSAFLLIGTDSEHFVERDGIISSAHGQIGGSKDKPLIVDKGNLQEDNILAEFAIDPVHTEQAWVESIHSVLNTLRERMKDKGYELVCKSSYAINKDKLLSFGGAMEMGCQPDYNVYSGRDNSRPTPFVELRTAAGHVHFSYENPSLHTTCSIVKCLDYCLGLSSLIYDEDRSRRTMYGRAGDIRLKFYGGEYRTLGNYWLRDAKLVSQVYKYTRICVEQHEQLLPMFNALLPEQDVVDAINSYNVDLAAAFSPEIDKIMEKFYDQLPA